MPAAVSLWPLTDTVANAQSSQGVSVWLHASAASFSTGANSSVATLCGQRARLFVSFDNYIQCESTLAGTRFVTVQRIGTTNQALGLQEVRIYRSSECARASGTPQQLS